MDAKSGDELPEIVLITAAQLPKPDLETHLLVDALTKLGVRVVVSHWKADMSWKDVPLVVLRTPWDYFHQPDEFSEWAAGVDKQTRLVNTYPLLKWNMHKSYLVDLAGQGVPTIPTSVIRAHGGRTLPVDLVALGFNGDTIVKPAISIGAFGVHRGEADSLNLTGHAHELLASGQDVIIQPFVGSVVDKGEMSLVFFDGQFSHSVRKIPKAGDFRVQDQHGGTVVLYEATAVEIAVATMALDASPARAAYARVDLLEGEDGSPLVIEVELIEPLLYFRYGGLNTFAEYLVRLLR